MTRRIRAVGEAAVPDWVAREARKFEYPDFDTVAPATQAVGGGGQLTVVVAASDAPDIAKGKADYQCTGTNDQDVIQAAVDLIQAAPHGGVIQLTSGHFFVTMTTSMAAGIILRGGAVNQNGVSLRGMGPESTIIEVDGAAGNGAALIDWSGSGSNEIRDLTIEDAANIASNYSAIIVTGYSRIYNVHGFISESGPNQYFINLSGDECVVRDCNILFGGVGVAMLSTNVNLITGCNIHTTIGVFANFATQVQVRDCYFGNGSPAILASTTDYVFVSGCQFVNDGTAIELSDSEHHHIADSFMEPGGHGVHLDNVNDVLIEGVVWFEGGYTTDNTFDAVLIEGTSSDNFVTGNKLTPRPSGNQPRYGVNIADATCVCNVVVGNVLGNSADYGTDALNDAGTDTQLTYPNDPTYGDNFTDCGSPGSP